MGKKMTAERNNMPEHKILADQWVYLAEEYN